MPAVPLPLPEEDQSGDFFPPPESVPYIPEVAPPTPAPAPELTEPQRQRAIKGSKLRLEAATQDVERLKPTLEKVLTGVGLNIGEGAIGATKQIVGNAVRDWTDIVAPPKPHAPGSFKSFLQVALRPYDPTMGGLGIEALMSGENPEGAANILRTAGQDIATSGTEGLRTAAAETEQLGGGPIVAGASSLASTFGASSPVLLAGPGGLTALSIASGLQSYGTNIEDFKTKLQELHPELSEQQAHDKAMFPAAVTAASTALFTRFFGGTERFIEEQIVKRGLTTLGAKDLLREVFKAATLEVPEEYLDQLSQGFVEKAYIDPNKSIKDIFDEAGIAGLSAFALGGITTGSIGGVFHGGSAIGKRVGEVVEQSNMRRQSTAASRRRIQQSIAEREVQDALRERQAAESVRGVPEQPQQGEGQMPTEEGAAGVPQRNVPPRTQVQPAPAVATQDVVQDAIRRSYPEPPPLPKTALFGGYLYDNPQLPSYKIPGVRPGIMRDVSAATARQYGYQVPDKIPTFEEWNAAGRPATTTPEVSFSPAAEAGVPPAMQEWFPGQNVQQIAAQYASIPTEVLAAYPGGVTKFMHDLGSMAHTPQDVAALKAMADVHAAEFKRLAGAGQFDTAMLFSGRQAPEAYEYATGVTLAGAPKWSIFEKMRPGYVPTVPDAAYLKERGIAPGPEATQVATQTANQAAQPVNWHELSYVNKDGVRVLNESALRQHIESGRLKGAPGVEALLLHLIKRSDLHPLEPVKIITDLTPDQLSELARSGFAQPNAANRAASASPYAGLFIPKPGTATAEIEVNVRNNDSNIVSQQEFLRIMAHEFVHNNITSKFQFAPPALQARIQSLYLYVLEKAQGTAWQNHNATTNSHELFSDATTIPELQQWLLSLDYSEHGKKPKGLLGTVWGQVLDTVRKVLGLPDTVVTSTGRKVDVITALDEIMNLSAEAEKIQRPAYAAETGTAPSPSPATPAGLPPKPGPTEPPLTLSEAQVAAGTAEVGRVAENAYKTRENATAALEGTAYEKKEFRTARDELRRLSDLALAGYTQQQIADPERFVLPDPTLGVNIDESGQIAADDKFTTALTIGGVPHNPENVQHLQRQVYYEQSAHRYNKLGQQIATLNDAKTYYTQLGVDAAEVKKIDKELAKLEKSRTKLGGAELDGHTVSERAGEMTVAEGARQDRMAKRDALSLEPVTDFFGRQIGGYRNFIAKAKAGLAFANAAVSNTDPEGAKVAMAEAQKWMNIPVDVRNSILSNRPLSEEQRASIFASLAQTFEEFDFAGMRMRDLAGARIPELNGKIRKLLLEVAKAKEDSGMADVLISDVLATLDGETGATGNLKSMEETNTLRQRLSAIKSFAANLGKNIQENQQLYDWILDPNQAVFDNIPLKPGEPYPARLRRGNMGVDDVTLGMILREVKRNPAFNSALLTLINSADAKLEGMPLTGLKQIEDLLSTGTQEDQQTAELIADGMLDKANAQSSLAAATLKEKLKQLDAMQIERKSLQEGMAMFQEVAVSPDFGRIRDATNNSKYGLVEPMIEQNHTTTLLKGFGAPNLPSHAELSMDASKNPHFKSEAFKKVWNWAVTATQYINAYDVAARLHNDAPETNPAPIVLGFDLPKVKGLRDAVDRLLPGSFLDLSLNSEGKRWRVPGLVRQMSKTSFFRQHDLVAKMVGGQTGFDLRARLADFVNHFLIAQGIRDDYRNIPDLLHKALQSHPELNMSIANYREHFNELAHIGRIFGSPLKAGLTLPRTGRMVTEADMTLLQRERAYEEQLRRRVTETNVTQGVRVKTPTRTLVRPGAYVGDEGLPRFQSQRAEPFIADVREAYNVPPPAYPPTPPLPGTLPPPPPVPTIRSFGPTTVLGASSDNPVVQFWNRNIPLVVQHILDSRRVDRAMNLSPAMQQAEADLMAQWTQPGMGVPALKTLEDVVNALMKYYPSETITGYNKRDQVVKGLNDELRQYRDAAQRITEKRTERDQARAARPDIAFSADNEFTKPAAKLELPSALYDYGALSPGDHIAISSRANHERIVGYATAIQRAIGDIQSRLTRFKNKEITLKEATESYGGNIQEMEDVLNLLQKISEDFKNAYDTGGYTNKPRGIINDTMGLLTSAILALPTVGLRNMTQGQMEVYAVNRAMGNAGHWMTVFQTLKAMPRTLTRFALHLADGILKRSNVYAGMLTGENRHMFEDMVGKIGNALTGEDFRAVAEQVRNLGMDSREDFLKRLGRIWQETGEFLDDKDLATTAVFPKSVPLVGGRKIKGVAGILPKGFRALFDKIGVNQYDFAINTSALYNAENLARRIKEVAIEYGKSREGLGPFDPTNRAFDLKASEWSSAHQAQAEDSLGWIRHMLESSVSPLGFQLESSMWNYYQRYKAGQKTAPLFTPPQMDAFQRRLLADYNASTPANRPSAIAGNNVIRNILLLQGYPSDLMLKLFNSAAGKARDRGGFANAVVKAPVIASLAMMAILIGYFTSAVTGSFDKYAQGRMPSLATPLDKDFWTSFKRFGLGTLALGSAQLGYLGDIILGFMGEIRGNRGFDPTGRILTASLISRFLAAMRGAISTSVKGAGDKSDFFEPMADVARSMVPYWLTAQNILDKAMGSARQSERIRQGEAMTQGLVEGRSGFQTATYGPTTIVRRNLLDAISRWADALQGKDTETAGKELDIAKEEIKKLYDYHYARQIALGKDDATAKALATRQVWNDYQSINPAVASLLGRRPSAAEEEQILSGITGDRRAMVDRGDAAWKAGAQALFGRQGSTTREEVAAGRAGMGGPGFPLPRAASFRFPSLPGGGVFRTTREARIPTSAPARAVGSRLRRSTQAGLRAQRVGASAIRRGIPRAFRQSRQRIGPTVRPVRTRLGSRRRREYALA